MSAPGLPDPLECNCDCVSEDVRKISVEEMDKHKTDKSCWVLLKDDVWDLTPFLMDHPGGPSAILEFAGRDATAVWESVHPPEVLSQLSKSLRVGVADMDLAAAASAPTEASGPSEKLLHACKLGGSTEVEDLLAANADPNFQGGPGREAPIHWAARKGAPVMAKSLMEAKASLNSLDAEGQTPLILAARNGQLEVLKMLVVSNAGLNVQDERGETALHAAAGLGSVKIVKALLATDIDLAMEDKEGNTAADTADERGNMSAENLIRAKMD